LPAETPPVDRVAELQSATNTEKMAYYRCVRLAALDYVGASESANTVAQAAMTRCSMEEQNLRRSIELHNRTPVADYRIQEVYRNSIRSDTVELVIRVRESSRKLEIQKNLWAECVVKATFLNFSKGTKGAISTAYSECSQNENGMRAAWTSLIDAKFAEERLSSLKQRVTPILAKYAEELAEAAGAKSVKKPRMESI
jgi:hypothetical protein